MKQGAGNGDTHECSNAPLTALAWPATLLAATDCIDGTWIIAFDMFNFIP